MKSLVIKSSLLCILIALSAPAFAKHDNGHGHQAKNHQRYEHQWSDDPRFDDDQRGRVHEYYHGRYERGFCPPGLAKKHNGCMPPGQERKWHVGERLPRDVVVYPVPRSVEYRLGKPPAGYKYIRVASDILLIAIGSSMVVDAIEDIGRVMD